MVHRQRYQNFSASGTKIHPIKRLASWLARGLPEAWRFRLLGLPPKSRMSAVETSVNRELHAVSNGIACQNGAHLDAAGAYIPHLTLGSDRFVQFRFLQRQRHFPAIIEGPPGLLSLSSEGDLNYYRWLLETLPRFRFIEEAGTTFDAIYCCQQQRFHRESIDFFAGSAVRIISSGEKRFVRSRRLTLPRFVDEAEKWVIPWMRDKILPRLSAGRSSGGSRFYISRRKASGRRIANETELLGAIETLGFSPVLLEEMPWLEQARLFREAEAIVAPHGAGLANLIFCSPGARVVELIAPEYPFTFYPEICRRTRLRHHLVHGRALNAAGAYSSDLHVDVAQVCALLE